MYSDIRAALRPAIMMVLLFTALLGLAYPLAVLAIGQMLFPFQANGSLIVNDGKVIGSSLVGQSFSSPHYFHTRPSAAGDGYDGSASSGSNLGPTSAALIERTGKDVASLRAAGVQGPIPADMVTASASGLDPDISPAAAFAQVDRVARLRGLHPAKLRSLVEHNVEHPLLGFLGEPHVNVLQLNRQVDRMAAEQAM